MTGNKTNLIMLAATGRVGTNFLLSTIRSDRQRWFSLGEFFNHIYWNLCLKTEIVSLMCKHKSDDIFYYQEWLRESATFLRRNVAAAMQQGERIPVVELERFIKPSTEELYNITVKFLNDTIEKNTVTKIFMYNTSLENTDRPNNNIDINKTLKYGNALLIPYRKNALLTYISEIKAGKHNIWYIAENGVNIDKLEMAQNFKIQWNKQEYVQRFKQYNDTHKKMFEIYEKFDGSKTVITYETLHAQQDKLEYIQDVYDKNDIGIKTNINFFQSTMRQSKDQPLEDHFTNPEEFLKDLPDIPIFLDYEY